MTRECGPPRFNDIIELLGNGGWLIEMIRIFISWNKKNNVIEIITGQAYTPEGTEGSVYYSRYRN
ncbi:hypothetical protein D3C81_1876620 [compost metagenome]